jgi:hypothetical protein
VGWWDYFLWKRPLCPLFGAGGGNFNSAAFVDECFVDECNSSPDTENVLKHRFIF